MAISFIAANSTDASTGTAISLTHGFTISAGDVIVVLINVNGAGRTVSDNNGAKAFTSDDNAANADSATAYVFSRYCDGGEGSSFAFTASSSGRWSIIARQYRGVDSSKWDVAPSASTRSASAAPGPDTTAEAPSITIVTSGACGIVLMADDYAPTTTTFSSVDNGYGNVRSESGQQYIASADKLGLSTGSTGVTTITSSDTVTWVAWQVALKPDTASSGQPTIKRFGAVPHVPTVNKHQGGFVF